MQAPTAPDPVKTAQAQTQSNIATATAQQNVNQVNQVTPTGSLTYQQTGTNADGTPKYTATTALSAPQQAILSGQQGAEQNLLGQIGTQSQTPFNVDSATEDQLDTLGEQRLDPELQKQTSSLQQQLANQGVTPGSQAYNNAMTLNSQSQNDARNSLILNGYSTAQQSALAQANQPYSELGDLISGQPTTTSSNLANTPQAGVQPTDTTSDVNTAYQDQLAQYNGQMQALGSIASTLGGWAFSDRRLKTDIQDTGMKTKDDIPVKTFRMKGSPMLQMGVIAQEAEQKRPDAVRTGPGGFKQINPAKLKSPMLALGSR